MKHKENTSLLIKILTDSASELDQSAFDKWLNESKENQVYFQNVKIIWDGYSEFYDKMEFDQTLAMEKIKEKIKVRQPRPGIIKMRPWYWAAASIIFLLGVVLFYNNKPLDSDLITYESGKTVTELVLSDSTHVWLNINSKLIAPKDFPDNKRNVNFEGEAFFEVSKDVSRPFKVKAGKTTTEVLGTSFNLLYKEETGKVRLIVSSGKVAFYKTNSFKSKKILLPGNKIKYFSESDKFEFSENTNPNYLSWKTDTLTFYDTPLVKVCSSLSQHFHREITTNIENMDITLTACFNNESLEDILEIIELTLDVRLVKSEKEIQIVK